MIFTIAKKIRVRGTVVSKTNLVTGWIPKPSGKFSLNLRYVGSEKERNGMDDAY